MNTDDRENVEFPFNDSPLTCDELSALLYEAGIFAGWDDPELDVYNNPIP